MNFMGLHLFFEADVGLHVNGRCLIINRSKAEAKLDAVIFDEGQVAQAGTAQVLLGVFFQFLEVEFVWVAV